MDGLGRHAVGRAGRMEGWTGMVFGWQSCCSGRQGRAGERGRWPPPTSSWPRSGQRLAVIGSGLPSRFRELADPTKAGLTDEGGATETEGRLMPARGGPPSALEPAPAKARLVARGHTMIVEAAIVGFNFAAALLAMMVPGSSSGGGGPRAGQPPPPGVGPGRWVGNVWQRDAAPSTAVARFINPTRRVFGHGFLIQFAFLQFTCQHCFVTMSWSTISDSLFYGGSCLAHELVCPRRYRCHLRCRRLPLRRLPRPSCRSPSSRRSPRPGRSACRHRSRSAW